MDPINSFPARSVFLWKSAPYLKLNLLAKRAKAKSDAMMIFYLLLGWV